MTEPNAPRRCIFYNALPMNFPPNAGSSLHQARMLEAFKAIGYEVDLVAGYSAERRQCIRHLKENIRRGVKYDFLYVTPPTSPILLSDQHHLPLHPLLDYTFFRYCYRQGIPVGWFNLDVWWRFPEFRRRLNPFKAWTAYFFYLLDLLVLRCYADILFVPHLGMARLLPFWPASKPVLQLMPGLDPDEKLVAKPGSKLNIIYVGGLSATFYNIAGLLEGVWQARQTGVDVNLTICCRQDEWDVRPTIYNRWLGSHVLVVHNHTRAELLEFYAGHNLTAHYLEHPYWNLTLPLKFFEAIGLGLPVICRAGAATAELAVRLDIGWSVPPQPAALKDFLVELTSQPALIQQKARNCLNFRNHHTWAERARQVAAALTSLDRDRELV